LLSACTSQRADETDRNISDDPVSYRRNECPAHHIEDQIKKGISRPIDDKRRSIRLEDFPTDATRHDQREHCEMAANLDCGWTRNSFALIASDGE
jgi:hypothetical protein